VPVYHLPGTILFLSVKNSVAEPDNRFLFFMKTSQCQVSHRMKSVPCIVRLPKTRSGKILRKTICNIADGVEYAVPSTIDDPLISYRDIRKIKRAQDRFSISAGSRTVYYTASCYVKHSSLTLAALLLKPHNLPIDAIPGRKKYP
jgi:hypothetical protein